MAKPNTSPWESLELGELVTEIYGVAPRISVGSPGSRLTYF